MKGIILRSKEILDAKKGKPGFVIIEYGFLFDYGQEIRSTIRLLITNSDQILSTIECFLNKLLNDGSHFRSFIKMVFEHEPGTLETHLFNYETPERFNDNVLRVLSSIPTEKVLPQGGVPTEKEPLPAEVPILPFEGKKVCPGFKGKCCFKAITTNDYYISKDKDFCTICLGVQNVGKKKPFFFQRLCYSYCNKDHCTGLHPYGEYYEDEPRKLSLLTVSKFLKEFYPHLKFFEVRWKNYDGEGKYLDKETIDFLIEERDYPKAPFENMEDSFYYFN